MSGLHRLYRALPPFARSAVASVRGWHLDRRRYGPDADRLVDEARERERWSEERWTQYRHERLARILHTAATEVPFYREQWAERRRRGDRASWDRLDNWPILEKETIRKVGEALVAEDQSRRRLVRKHTSGTTGTPLEVWTTRTGLREWYALFEARNRSWAGVSRHDPWAIIGGQLIVPVTRKRPPFWVWNRGMKQLYLSAYHLDPASIPHHLQALLDHRVRYIVGYTSALEALAREAARIGWSSGDLEVVLTNAEPLLSHQREIIGRGLAPVRETYGLAEMVMGASECEAGHLHTWPDAGLLEVFEGKTPLPGGETGDLVCTGLLNPAMPLIRYRLGDRGSHATGFSPCACGRTLPRLGPIEGRIDDVLHTADGRPVGRLDPVFKSDLPIREAQIIQESLTLIRVLYVPDPEREGERPARIVDELRSRLGDVRVEIEAVSAIPRGSSGKFRGVVCKLSAEEKARIRRAGEA